MMDQQNQMRLGGGSIALGGGAAAKGFGAIVVLLALWVAAYMGGLAPWLGFEQRTVQSVGVGPVAHVGGLGGGLGIGLDSFVFLEGQELFVDYDVEIRSGSLGVRLLDWGSFEHVWRTRIAESATGRVSFRIPRTGLYELTIEPSPLGGRGEGYDLTYGVTWGAGW